MKTPDATREIVDHLFRHESGRIMSVLTRHFGFDRMEMVEDVVQDALLKALQMWPFHGVPDNPAGWIMKVARNNAIDFVRRERTVRSKHDQIVLDSAVRDLPPETFSEREIEDDQLRMMFACCHPSLPAESQIALVLRTLCGFGTDEIARAFLSNRETIHKRLVRAKRKLRQIREPFGTTDTGSSSVRLDSVRDALYLLFNEGYNASSGPVTVREDLCAEAILLTRILAHHRSGNKPETHGLLALMLFHGARLRGRTDDLGNILLLRDQDRRQWNGAMIREGFAELELSGAGDEISRYHLEAGIAACHCLAPTYQDTNWERILTLYDLLVQINESPVVSLNRAVAVFHVRGAGAGIDALEQMRERQRLDRYYLLYAVMGEFHSALGNHKEAAESYRKALELTQVRSEQAFLTERLALTRQSAN